MTTKKGAPSIGQAGSTTGELLGYAKLCAEAVDLLRTSHGSGPQGSQALNTSSVSREATLQILNPPSVICAAASFSRLQVRGKRSGCAGIEGGRHVGCPASKEAVQRTGQSGMRRAKSTSRRFSISAPLQELSSPLILHDTRQIPLMLHTHNSIPCKFDLDSKRFDHIWA